MKISRRRFNQHLLALALTGLSRHVMASPMLTGYSGSPGSEGYGELIPDPSGILDLPKGFSYRIISSLGELMSDGLLVPDRADGMGCFAVDEERVVLVRNHELSPIYFYWEID